MSDLYLLRFALRDLLRPKKLLAAAALIALPTFLAVQFLWHDHDDCRGNRRYGNASEIASLGHLRCNEHHENPERRQSQ